MNFLLMRHDWGGKQTAGDTGQLLSQFLDTALKAQDLSTRNSTKKH